MFQALSLNIFCHFLLSYKVFAEKSVANLWSPMFMISCFCFATFKNLSLIFFFISIIIWLGGSLFSSGLRLYASCTLFCISDWFFLIFFKSLLTFLLNSSILLLNVVSILMTAYLNSLFSKILISISLASPSSQGFIWVYCLEHILLSPSLTFSFCFYELAKTALSPVFREWLCEEDPSV